jgi:HNH endonuclease
MKSCKIANHEMYTIFENGEVHSGKRDVVLVQRTNPNGYQIVALDGKQLSVHRLVASHFIPNPYQHLQVNHKDGNKSHNHVSNLEWCSEKFNAHHALETGLRGGFVHVDIRRALLERVLQGESVFDLVGEVGNHPNTLNRMLRNQAEKDGRMNEWKTESQRKRKMAALKNLEIINVRN